MEVLTIVVTGGFTLIAVILSLMGRNVLHEVRGVQTDLQQFKLQTETRLTTIEVSLKNLLRQLK